MSNEKDLPCFQLPAGSPCPTCGAKIDAATNVTGRGSPEAGDLTVCLYCGEVLVFDGELRPRRARAKDLADVPGDTLALLKRMRVLAKKQAAERQ